MTKDNSQNTTSYIVSLTWDEEASVWVAESKDIPGLILESGSIDALIERLRFAIPELLTLNGIDYSDGLSICYRVERYERVLVQ